MQYQFLLFLSNAANPFLDALANALSFLAEEAVLVAVCVVVFYCVGRKEGFVLLSGLVGAEITTNAMKAVARFPRPFQVHPELAAGRLDTATGYSFPSGHTTGAAAFWPAIGRMTGRKWALWAGIVLAVLIGLSRNYLMVHWPMDVVAGLCIGLVFSLASPRLFTRIWDDSALRLRFALIAGTVTAISGALLMALIALAGADETAFSDLSKILALAGGCYLGLVLEEKKAGFKAVRKPGKAAANLLFAVAGIGLAASLKLILPESLYWPGAFLRYFLMGFWAVGVWPVIAIRAGLMEREG